MPKINSSINISAPVEKVFAYVADPLANLEWLVGTTEVTDVTGSGIVPAFSLEIQHAWGSASG